MKNLKYIIGFLFLTLFTITGCQEDDYEFGEIVPPANIQLTAEIVGADATNPNGDGSGVVHFTATADNAITYKFIHDGSETVSADGKFTISFGRTGTFKYTVTVVASGTAGISSSTSVEVEVLVLYSAPADLLQMLHGGSSKTWRVKNEAAGHMGVGPAEETSPIWWGAGPDEKAHTGLYSDRYTFNADGTYSVDTAGSIFGKAPPLTQDFGTDHGLTANGDNEFENFPEAGFDANWALSAPGGNETISLTGNGYLGFYVGSHSFQILERTENEMKIKSVGFDGLGWFMTLIAD